MKRGGRLLLRSRSPSRHVRKESTRREREMKKKAVPQVRDCAVDCAVQALLPLPFFERFSAWRSAPSSLHVEMASGGRGGVPKRTFQLAAIYPKVGKNTIRYKRANFYTFTKEFQGDNLRVRYMRVRYNRVRLYFLFNL